MTPINEFHITDPVEFQTEKWDLHSIAVTVSVNGMDAHHTSRLPLREKIRGVNTRAAGVCNLQVGCAYTVGMSAAGGQFPWNSQLICEGGRHVSFSPSFPGLVGLRSSVIVTHTSFSVLRYWGRRLISVLFILSRKSSASPLQQELSCDDVSMRKCNAILVSGSIMTCQRWLVMWS